jgi:uncharacterized protein (TIGR00251 family)
VQDETILSVRVTTRAPRDEVTGWTGDELQVRLRAPPVEGAANEALRRLLAKRLKLAPSAIDVVSGAVSRHKRLRIAGLDAATVRERLSS